MPGYNDAYDPNQANYNTGFDHSMQVLAGLVMMGAFAQVGLGVFFGSEAVGTGVGTYVGPYIGGMQYYGITLETAEEVEAAIALALATDTTLSAEMAAILNESMLAGAASWEGYLTADSIAALAAINYNSGNGNGSAAAYGVALAAAIATGGVPNLAGMDGFDASFWVF